MFVESLPSSPFPGNFYVVVNPAADYVVNIGSLANIQNVAVVSNHEIRVGSRSSFSNVVLATRDKLTFGSQNQIGAANYCATGTGGVHLFSDGDYEAQGSQNSYSGVQIAALGDVNLGSLLESVTGISVQAGGDITFGSNEIFGACGVTPIVLNSDVVIRIVD